MGNGSLLKVKVRKDARIALACQSKLGPNIDVLCHFGFDGCDPVKGSPTEMAFHGTCTVKS